MTFQHPEWIYLAVPLLLMAVALRFWRRHYWGHPLVEQFRADIGRPNPILRLPTILEGAAVVFLLIGLLGPVYPFVLNRIERGGLQIMIVLDLSQSMEKPLGKSTRMDAVKASTTEFIKRRPGDAIGLRSEEHTSELQSQSNLVCRLLLEKKKTSAKPGQVIRASDRCLPYRSSAGLQPT